MKDIKHFIKSSSYKYPTIKERKIAQREYPNLQNFGFENNNDLIAILSGCKMDEVKRNSLLFEWDLCLLNKLGKLNESYIYLITNYNRGIPDDISLISNKIVNRLLFDYYTEMFYYTFFSVRDIILQIINIYCNINEEEKKIILSRFIPKINNPEIKELIVNFQGTIISTSEYRNSLIHRFPINQPDFRSKVNISDGYSTYSPGKGNFTEPIVFVENINFSLNILSKLINELRNLFFH